jgi:hypothetical protein
MQGQIQGQIQGSRKREWLYAHFYKDHTIRAGFGGLGPTMNVIKT